MKHFILGLTVWLSLAPLVAMAGNLQNADFATAAAIISGGGTTAQLLNTAKIFDNVNAQLLNTTLASFPPSTRAINTTAPLAGGGNLSADRTLTCNVASGSQAGCLASADFTTFAAKQDAISTSGAVANQFVTGFTAPNTFTRAQPSFSNLSGNITNAQLPTYTNHGVLLGTGAAGINATGAGTAGQVLTSNGASADPTFQAASAGTVTSVAASVPAFLSISGSPITTSGTLAITLSGTALPVTSGGLGVTSLTNHGVVLGQATSAVAVTSAGTAGQVLTSNGAGADPTFQAAATGGSADAVLTKTASYTVVTGDFNANKKLMLECNCTSDCNITFPAASNSGFELSLINIGTATCTGVLAGSDTYGSNTDTTWILPAGGNPQASNTFRANGGTRWNGF